MSWRAKFSHRIRRILETYPDPTPNRERALRLAYPLATPWRGGPSYPYKIWRDEIARQSGEKPQLRARIQGRHKTRCAHTLELFDRKRCPLTIDLFD